MILASAVALVLAGTIAGCAAQPSGTSEGDSKPTKASKESATPTATPTPEADDYAACDAFGNVMLPAQDVIDALMADETGQTIDRSQLDTVIAGFHEAESTATPALYVKLHPAADVFYVIDGLFKGTETNQTLDTGGYRDGVIATLQYCTDTVGYTKSNS
jgi:hypothetical protein